MGKECIKIQSAVLLCALGFFAFLLAAPYGESSVQTRETRPAVAVQVKGEVARPGLYLLEPTSATVAAAAARAGLCSKLAEAEAQTRLLSGQSLEIVRTKGGVAIELGRMRGAALLAFGLKLDLNSAPLGDLLLVPHLRPGIAEAIVARRNRKPWASVGELREIRGVGPKTIEKLHDYLEAGGGCAR